MNRTKNHIDSVAMKFKFAGMALPNQREAAENFYLGFLKLLYELNGPELNAGAIFIDETPYEANYALYTLPKDHAKLEEDLHKYQFFSLGAYYMGKKKLNNYKAKPSERAFEVFRILEKKRDGEDVHAYAIECKETLLRWFNGHDSQLSDFTIPFSRYGQVSRILTMGYGFKADYDEEMVNGEKQVPKPLMLDAWLPRFLTNGSFSEEQQQFFVDELNRLCEAYSTSMAVLSTEMLYGPPLRFSIHDELRPITEYDFSSTVPGVGWGLCLSKSQIDLLGGFDTIVESAPIHNLIRYKHGGGMMQLTPDINSIGTETLLAFRDYLNPFLLHGEFPTHCQYLLDTYCRLPIREEDFVFAVPDGTHAFLKLLL